MRPKLSLKVLYRSPIKTILTFLLLAAVTFALFSQVMEYAVTSREMKKAVELYDGVGSIEVLPINETVVKAGNAPIYIFSDERVPTDHLPEMYADAYRQLGYEHLTKELTEKLAALPYVSYVDTRYMTSGVTEMRRMDEGTDYYDYTNIAVIEGTVKSNEKDLILTDVELIGGEAIPVSGFGQADIIIESEPEGLIMITSGEESPQQDRGLYYWFAAGRVTTFATKSSIYDYEYLDTLEAGERYVFVTRYEDYLVPRPTVYSYMLTDPFIYGQCEAVYSLDGEPENYLETEKFAPLKEYIDLVNTDQHTFDMVYTKNMNSIRYFADKTIGVSEGRAITPEDTEYENNVCVIHHDLAAQYELSVGDVIDIKLGNKLFEQYNAVGAIAAVTGRLADEYTDAELEIVGIFKDSRGDELQKEDPAWSYNSNTIFVPQHLLSVSETELENHTFAPGEFSFVIDNAWDIPAFAEEVIPTIDEMGITLFFEDQGFGGVLNTFRETERIALIKIAVLIFAIIVITWFVSMLYIVGRKRDYAIMRLLGTSKREAAKALIIPLGVIAVTAVIIGSTAAYVYTANNIAYSESLSALSGFEIDLSIPAWLIAACVLGELVLTILMALMLLGFISRKLPLELMQGTSRTVRKQRRKNKHYVPESAEPVVLGQWQSIERLASDGKNRSVQFILRYAVRHIKRTVGKSVLFIIVTVLLINIVGQLVIMKNAYIDLFENTEIVSNYAGFMNRYYITQLQESGYVKDIYYRALKNLEVNGILSETCITSDIAHFAQEEVSFKFHEGYDETVMDSHGNVLIAGEKFMSTNGFSLGDTVYLGKEGMVQDIKNDMLFYENGGIQFGTHEEYQKWLEEFYASKEEEIQRQIIERCDPFIIVGSVTSESGLCNNMVFTPGSEEMNVYHGSMVIMDITEATLTDNWKAEEYRTFGEELAKANLTGEIAFVMDTTKIENIRNNIDLMDTLYPIMVAAVLIIGAFLCGMLIVQSSKDITIMRVLGTSKGKVRKMMITEQMILCIIGAVLAVAVLLVRGTASDMLHVVILYILAVLLSAVVAGFGMSRKSPLRLLQMKE